MTVSELITVLSQLDPTTPVVIAGTDLGFGVDFNLDKVHQYDNTEYIRLCPGAEFEEEDFG
jgi:hypothetical protein